MANTRKTNNVNGNGSNVNYARSISYEQAMALSNEQAAQYAQSSLDNGRELATSASAQFILGAKGIHDSAVQTGVGVLLARASNESLADATTIYQGVIAAQKKASTYGLNYAELWVQTFLDVCGQLVPDRDHEGLYSRVASCRAVKYTKLEESGLMGFVCESNTKLNKAYANYWQVLRLLERLDNAPTFQSVEEEKKKADYVYTDAYKDFDRIMRKAKLARPDHSEIRNIVREAIGKLDKLISANN